MQERKHHDQFIKDINRAVSIWIAKELYARTKLTANQLTVLRILFGILAALLFLSGHYIPTILAAILLQLFSTLDAADGELARLRGSSYRGAWLDSQSDNLIIFFIFISLSFRFAAASSTPVLMAVWTMATLALMFLLRKSLSQSKREKITGAGKEEVIEAESEAPALNSWSSFNARVNRIAFPSPAFYVPVILIGAIAGNVFAAVLFIHAYLVVSYGFVLVRTYFECVARDAK